MPLITPRVVDFGAQANERMWKYTEEQYQHLENQSLEFRTNTLPDWKRMLRGKPKTETKNFPFEGASNLVVQLIATRCEQILSRIMALYMIDPIFAVTAIGDLIGQESDENAQLLQQFLSDMAVDPEALNLYRKEELFFYDSIAYGTNFMHFPYLYITESQYTNIGGTEVGIRGAATAADFSTIVMKDGPAPENIPIQQILIDNKTKNFDTCRSFFRIIPLTREAVEDRIEFGVWTKAKGEAVLKQPDTTVGLFSQEQEANDSKFQDTGSKYDAIYKIYEHHFKFTHNRATYSIISHYHPTSKTRLKAVFNYFPKNQYPFEDCRFGYDSDNYYGYGFCEMLAGYQDELSTLHNNRLDNEAIRNNVTFRINKDSELASTLKFYPGVTVPADKDEVEALITANAGSLDNGQSESMTVGMANERSGVDPAITGMGSGIVNPKRGVYSSQGTMAVLQQQNNRTGLRMMDVRQTHLRIGRKLVDMYAIMGAGNKIKRYGQQAQGIVKALEQVRQGNLGLLLKTSAGSNNIEVDRQNSVLVTQLQEKYIGTVNQLLQLMTQAQNNPEQTQYIQNALIAQQTLTRHIFRIFGYYDVDKLLPFPESVKNARLQQQQGQQPAAGSITRQPGEQSSQAIPSNVPFSSSGLGNSVPSGPTQ